MPLDASAVSPASAQTDALGRKHLFKPEDYNLPEDLFCYEQDQALPCPPNRLTYLHLMERWTNNRIRQHLHEQIAASVLSLKSFSWIALAVSLALSVAVTAGTRGASAAYTAAKEKLTGKTEEIKTEEIKAEDVKTLAQCVPYVVNAYKKEGKTVTTEQAEFFCKQRGMQ